MSLITLKDELQNYLTYENYLDKYLMNACNIKKHLQIYSLLLIEYPTDLKNNIFKFFLKKTIIDIITTYKEHQQMLLQFLIFS